MFLYNKEEGVGIRKQCNHWVAVSLGFYAPEDHVMLQLVEGCKYQIHVVNYLNRKDQLISCYV